MNMLMKSCVMLVAAFLLVQCSDSSNGSDDGDTGRDETVEDSGQDEAGGDDVDDGDEDIESLQDEHTDAKEQFLAFEEKIEEIDRLISAALQKGDKEKLRRDLENQKRETKQLDNRIQAAIKEHSNLFRGSEIAIDLLQPVLSAGFKKAAFPRIVCAVVEMKHFIVIDKL